MKKVKWGVIGAGGIADRRTIPGMLTADNAELVAVMEINMELAESLRQKHGAKRAYISLEEILADEEIEAVYIATPVIYHKEQALKAAKAKKHILIEKPLALTIKDGEEVIKACDVNGVLLATGLMMRYHGYHQEMKKLIAEGAIGEIVSIRAQLTCWYPKMEGNWRQQKATSGGGSMMDMGIHCIDLVEYITGHKMTSVMGFCSNKIQGYEVEDSAMGVFKMDNGAYACIDTFFNIPDEAAKCNLEIYGTKGSFMATGTISQIEAGRVEICITDDSLGYSAIQNRNNEGVNLMDCELGNMYTKEIESFSKSIIDGSDVLVSAAQSIHVQDCVVKFYQSSDERKEIMI